MCRGFESHPSSSFFLFGEKRVVWVSCLPLFSIYRKEFSCDYSTWSVTSLVHWWFNYPGPLLEVELESACLSGRVRRPLYSFDSTQPLGCLGGSVVRASVLASSVSWVRIPPEQLFFLFGEKRVVWVSCLPLFSIYRKEFSCIYIHVITYIHVLAL